MSSPPAASLLATKQPLPPSPPPSHPSRTPSPSPHPPPSTSTSAAYEYDAVLSALRQRQRQRHRRRFTGHPTLDDGALEWSWQEFPLRRVDFQHLYQQYLEPEHEALQSAGGGHSLAHWCVAKLRWDYDPDRQVYAIRMPTAIHEVFIRQLSDAIKDGKNKWLRDCAEPHAPATELEKVEDLRSTTISFASDSGDESDATTTAIRRHLTPDGQHKHRRARYPSLILEIAYSQSTKDLDRLAKDYIHMSHCHVACVIGIKLEYVKPTKGIVLDTARDQSATFSLWRPALDEGGGGYCDTIHRDVHFRNADGSIVSDAPSIELMISDLVPPSVYDEEGIPSDQMRAVITTITPTQLAEFLQNAEESYRSCKQPPRTKFGLTGQTTTRKRKRTPEEEVSSEREREFERKEAEEMEREKARDGSYCSKEQELEEECTYGDDASTTATRILPRRKRSKRALR
ncbi:hypothetical protein AC578_5290 [Pseudocercospora eumusae]|uniref:Uncharacterized protein n=1 Tax=Pseudocercospora eumusae TaxID=321146 RepID=A0A139GW99_9PEZI|nr:hypothetical protein AC578_5290 [Pseudocercospora eumusae]